MIKLKEIITQLDSESFKDIEKQLIKTHADNFLVLAQSYKSGNDSDLQIAEKLKLTSNSFYVLKSRLYRKIQTHLAGETPINKLEVLKQLQNIDEMCFTIPRETLEALLQKLEKDFLGLEMHNELILVYGAFKKVYLHSERYFHYSQLYNKQIAFALSLEKSIDTLGNFNRVLGMYGFSKSPELLNLLHALKNEIISHFELNPSHQIEIIKNIVELQIALFCETEKNNTYDISEELAGTRKRFNELHDSSPVKKRNLAIDFLHFEYYKKSEQLKCAIQYYEKVNASLRSLLLYNGISNTSRFFISKIRFLTDQGKTNEISEIILPDIYFDGHDKATKILFGMYCAMQNYYSQNIKNAIQILNELINNHCFKDFFHIQLEVKLTIAFFYISISENRLAGSLLKSVYKKIKVDELIHYSHALDLIKLFGMQLSKNSENKNRLKEADLFTLFSARNSGTYEILHHLLPELQKKFTTNLNLNRSHETKRT